MAPSRWKCDAENLCHRGGKPAGASAAATLRKEGFDGRVVLIGTKGKIEVGEGNFSLANALVVNGELLAALNYVGDTELIRTRLHQADQSPVPIPEAVKLSKAIELWSRNEIVLLGESYLVQSSPEREERPSLGYASELVTVAGLFEEHTSVCRS